MQVESTTVEATYANARQRLRELLAQPYHEALTRAVDEAFESLFGSACCRLRFERPGTTSVEGLVELIADDLHRGVPSPYRPSLYEVLPGFLEDALEEGYDAVDERWRALRRGDDAERVLRGEGD